MEKKKMETPLAKKDVDQQIAAPIVSPVIDEKNTKKKKKENSAAVAASKATSAVSQVDAHAYKDGGFGNSGTNLTYREDQ